MSLLIRDVAELSFPWPGTDPFLFCAHHVDHYPASDGRMGVAPGDLGGRPLGNDFSGQDGFNMYYGHTVPGFPSHPHRGFETVTFVRKGLIDHSDSVGARARYGAGDVQWLTAGAGVQHAEMFPLLDSDKPNEQELFQIWLNLPARSKFVKPAFKMLWAEDLPVHRAGGAQVTVLAGAFTPAEGGAALVPPSPAPDSWASDPQSDLAIWVVRLAPGAAITLPPAANGRSLRTLFLFLGDGLRIEGQDIGGNKRVEVDASQPLPLANGGADEIQLMLMQGVPLGEPVAAGGPFVMNTQEELHQARVDYTRTHFGGWPWPSREPVHGAEEGRFAQYPGQSQVDRPPGGGR